MPPAAPGASGSSSLVAAATAAAAVTMLLRRSEGPGGSARTQRLGPRRRNLAARASAQDDAVVDAGGETDTRLSQPDPRPVGPADLTDAEAREKAMHYLGKRQRIEDERFSTEQEWIHMFSVVGDLGAAMEMGARKDELEEELETMQSREAEIAEQLSEIRTLRNEVRSSEARSARLGEDMAQAEKDSEALQRELEATKEEAAARQAEASKLRGEAGDMKSEIKAMRSDIEEFNQELEDRKASVARLEAEVAAAKEEMAPKVAELESVRSKLAELEADAPAASQAAQKQSAELEITLGRIDSLTRQKEVAASKREELQVSIEEARAAMADLPKELEAITGSVEKLRAEAAELQVALGPKAKELEAIQEARQLASDQVAEISKRQHTVKAESDAMQLEAANLKKDYASLESEILDLTERKENAVDERDKLMQLVPKILTSRNSMLNDVASAVEEAKVMREELISQAKSTQERLSAISLESALVEKEKLLQSTAAEIGLAAQASNEGLRKATAALQTVSLSRERAEADFTRLQDAMRARLVALRTHEDSLRACTAEHQGVEDEVQTLIEGTAQQVEQFRNARASVGKFQKRIRRISGELDVESAADGAAPDRGAEQPGDPGAQAASAAFGLFGSLLKAGAEGLRESAEKANRKQLPGPKE